MPRAHNLPKYVVLDTDRYGNQRFYYRRAGREKVRLPDDKNSIAFEQMYKALLKDPGFRLVLSNPKPPRRIRLSRKMGYVYFLRTSQGVKIGFSEDPVSRVMSLKTGVAEGIHGLVVMPGSPVTEREMHRRFEASRLTGEWFKETSDITQAMAQAAAYGRVLKTEKRKVGVPFGHHSVAPGT